MTLFNHTVEYSTEMLQSEVDGLPVEIRKAIVEFDDFWGKRRTHLIAAPSDLWTRVKVGGTASAGCPPLAGMVTDVKQGIFRTVWMPNISNEVTCYCLPADDNLQVGEKGLVVDHMRHDPEQYGTFEKCIMRDIPAGSNPNLHSVNLILFKDDELIGVIHVDPYVIAAPNYDDVDTELSCKFIG